jgi:hypothetical protein
MSCRVANNGDEESNDMDHVSKVADDDSALIPARDVMRRYSICDRTLDRWLTKPGLHFPQPLIVNRRRYFRERSLVEWERRQARGTVAS